MAQGDVVVFQQFLVDVQEKLHDLENNEFRLSLITNAAPPLATTPDPRWGAMGTTDMSAHEVAPGGSYVSGGTLVANPSVVLIKSAAVFDADDPAMWAAASGNPSNARWAVLYNNTDSGKRCVAFVDLGSLFDMKVGDLDINFGADGIYRLAAA